MADDTFVLWPPGRIILAVIQCYLFCGGSWLGYMCDSVDRLALTGPKLALLGCVGSKRTVHIGCLCSAIASSPVAFRFTVTLTFFFLLFILCMCGCVGESVGEWVGG